MQVKVQEDSGQVRIVLTILGRPVGVATVGWSEYAGMCRKLMSLVLDETKKVISEHLAKMIWRDAQAHSDGSTDLAMKRLTELGWTQVQVERYADELSLLVAQRLVEHLPEHEG